jgi:hypothetical protein
MIGDATPRWLAGSCKTVKFCRKKLTLKSFRFIPAYVGEKLPIGKR